MSYKQKRMRVNVIKSSQSVIKAETEVQVSKEEAYNAGDWIMPPLNH